MAQQVELRAAAAGGVLTVTVVNRTPKPISVAAHPRYLALELKDAAGQFVAGRAQGEQPLPSAEDYPAIAAGATLDTFRLPIARAGDGWTIGPFVFPDVPERTELRALYKAEMIMPNLPEKQRKTFFRGPAESGRVAIALC